MPIQPTARIVLRITLLLLGALAVAADAQSDSASRSWNQPVRPFRIAGNVYYVGASDVTSFLITTPRGHVLVDGGFAETAPLIVASIRALGFRPEDVRLILASHAHYDHAGGLAELKRLTGARLVAGAGDSALLARGGIGDPNFGDRYPFPEVVADRLVQDGDTVTLGGTTMVARVTPGHTRGCTTWTTSVLEQDRQYGVVFVCSASVPGYRLVGNEKYPQIVADYRRTFGILRSLRCEVFLAAHGVFFSLKDKIAGLELQPDRNPFIDPEGCRAHIDRAERTFEARLREQTEAAGTRPAPGQSAGGDTLHLPGLREPVEILRDRWGIAHIYARNEHDLFFAQGYVAAKDRTFQFELWRRQATGTVAELLGAREVRRDIGTRLFRFRGDLSRELNYYHPRGKAIVEAFVAGVNALVAEMERDSTLVPLELKLLGTRPQRWTPDVVISRHQGLLGNVTEELATGRAVAALGAAKVREVNWYHPHQPLLDLDPKVDGQLLSADILGLYTAFRGPVRFQPSDLAAAYRADSAAYRRLAHVSDSIAEIAALRERRSVGSNNWVVSGRKTASGYPMMANDPHRAIAAPSLRYWVHLNAPGWNVIGGGEPVLPGVSIGHNEHGAWGLTIFSTDGEDLMVYETNPDDPRQYRYRGRWETMRSLTERIAVKGQAPVTATLRYTRHGPVVYEDTANHVAYAVRAAWMEVGGAPYLASLRMDQAKSWEEFREACAYSHIPGENMIWADRRGNIGWQAVGIAPIRRNFSGLVPVPGDGRYEWAGYLPMLEKPHAFNPPEGFIATANNNLTSPSFPHLDAIGYTWADPYRYDRIAEVLRAGSKFTVADMERLQNDYLSIPARQLVPLLRGVRGSSEVSERARQALLGWNFVLDASSVPAGIYEAWLEQLDERLTALVLTPEARRLLRNVPMKRMIEWLSAPDARFGADPVAGRDALLRESLDAAVAELTKRLGPDMDDWRWGQERYHHVHIRHPMSAAVGEDVRRRLEVGPAPRGGDGSTVGVTGTGNQRHGASFRIIADAADWDAAVGTNTPGQSGDPESPHYRDLFEMWASDRYFPVRYSRPAVEGVLESVTVLAPARSAPRASGKAR